MPSPADGAADATERYKQLKLNKYRRFLETMRAQGIAYVPIIWSSWGRPNPDAARVLKGLAARAARRRGLVSHADLLGDARYGISLQLWARAARMVIACSCGVEAEDAEEDT